MKNKIILTTVLGLMLCAFSACAPVEDKKAEAPANTKTETSAGENKTDEKVSLKDGEFKAVADKENASGYLEFVEIKVVDGKITSVNWDGTKGDSTIKKDVEAGKYDMKSAKTWTEQASLLEQSVLDNQGVSEIKITSDGRTDAIAGVSIHVNGFVSLVEKALSEAK